MKWVTRPHPASDERSDDVRTASAADVQAQLPARQVKGIGECGMLGPVGDAEEGLGAEQAVGNEDLGEGARPGGSGGRWGRWRRGGRVCMWHTQAPPAPPRWRLAATGAPW